jgi:hypothetical protein
MLSRLLSTVFSGHARRRVVPAIKSVNQNRGFPLFVVFPSPVNDFPTYLPSKLTFFQLIASASTVKCLLAVKTPVPFPAVPSFSVASNSTAIAIRTFQSVTHRDAKKSTTQIPIVFFSEQVNHKLAANSLSCLLSRQH